MGILPFYVRYGISGEQPRAKDDFERYQDQRGYWETVRSRQYSAPALFRVSHLTYDALLTAPILSPLYCRVMLFFRRNLASGMQEEMHWRRAGERSIHRDAASNRTISSILGALVAFGWGNHAGAGKS